MSVLPKQSAHALPECMRSLLSSADSEIIDFYPIDFPLDVNGFKFAWMGVNLLPFVNKDRLKAAVAKREHDLSEEQKERNVTGMPLLMFETKEFEEATEFFSKDAQFDESKEEDFNMKQVMKLGGKATGFSKSPHLKESLKSHRLLNVD